jgi:hypothetical protein
MIHTNDIATQYDSKLIQLTPLIIRDIRDKTEDGDIVYAPELQFQVRNISNAALVNLETEVNYFDRSGSFLGSDDDLRLDPLNNGEVQTFSLFIEVPEQTCRAELKIKARRLGIGDRIRSFFYHPIMLAFLIGYLVYSKLNP